LIDIQRVWESPSGAVNSYIPCTRVDFLPENVSPSAYRIWFAWMNQEIRFLAATGVTSLQIDYVNDALGTITDENTSLTFINGKTFLAYRTAALCASFIGENESRAEELNGYARMRLDTILGISNKGRQQIAVRRRPSRRGIAR
jgi:hypothetical protein